jgi:hypothetical protein
LYIAKLPSKGQEKGVESKEFGTTLKEDSKEISSGLASAMVRRLFPRWKSMHLTEKKTGLN